MDKIAAALLLVLISSSAALAQGTHPVPGSGEINIRDTLEAPARPVKQNGYVDPSRNVLDLVEAAIRRQDDLRKAMETSLELRIREIGTINELRFILNKELREAATLRLDNEARIRADYADKLNVAEAKRIDAIRAVDVNAVAVANQRTSEQATALQTQTSASAEVLRNQVARSAEDLRALVATTAATQLANQQQQFAGVSSQITTLSGRITTLEQAGSEGRGKSQFQDPAIAALTARVSELVNKQTATASTEQGRSDIIGWIFGAAGFLVALLGVLAAFLRLRQAPQTTA